MANANAATQDAPAATRHRLDNGLLLLTRENHSVPVVNFSVVYRVGSKYEQPGITGISHLLEHMMFKSTGRFPAGEFDRRLKQAGADSNAYTWLDQTVYYATIGSRHIATLMELEADRMAGLALREDELASERQVVLNELEQRDDSPFTLLYEELLGIAFTAHPYRIPTIGWRADVERLDVRTLRSYYEAFYQPGNAFITAVGDFDTAEFSKLVERYFGSLSAMPLDPPRITTEPPQAGARRFTIEKYGSMDYLLKGWHVPDSNHPDSYALVVLAQLLGEGRTCRLYPALVESGMCANVQSWSQSFSYTDPFLFMAGGVLNPGTEHGAVEEVITREIASLRANGPTPGELARACKQARASFIYDMDSIVDEAQNIIGFELLGSCERIHEYLPGIEAVTAADVSRVAAEYLHEANSTTGVFAAKNGEGGGEVPDGAV